MWAPQRALILPSTQDKISLLNRQAQPFPPRQTQNLQQNSNHLIAKRSLVFFSSTSRQRLPHRLRAAVDGEHQESEGEAGYSKDAERLYGSLSSRTERAGAEYGEGFVQFRLSGEPLVLDVDTLNDRLKVQGAARMRHAMCPDEAFGIVFNFDGVIADTRTLQRRAWMRLAKEEGLPFPRIERQLYDIPAQRAVTEVLQWTRDWGVAQRLAWRVAVLYTEEFSRASQPQSGLSEWLSALSKSKVPCAVVSNMDRVNLSEALERMGLGQFFQAKVTAEDGMETIAQRYLSAALKLGRPPNQCVVFAACPQSIVAARNCTMKAVGVLGEHKGYQLQHADLTCSRFSQLTVYNIRRLFANKGSEFMDLRFQYSGNGTAKRRITNATMDP